MAGQSSLQRWLIAVSCLLLFGVMAWKTFERQHWLSFPPPDLHVTKVLYVQTGDWGFGPGGNETGVVLYELPDHVAAQLRGTDAISLGVEKRRASIQAWN